MTAALIPTPVMQFLDADGNPLVGGKVYTYAAGTSTPLATYTDYGGATPNANPVILNSRGEASIWFGTAAYKLELYTAANVLIWTADNVSASTPVVYGTGVAAALAINVGTAGSILVNGGALVGTTLSASGTSTMAAINASGLVAMAGAATVGTTLSVAGASLVVGSSTFNQSEWTVTGTTIQASSSAFGGFSMASSRADADGVRLGAITWDFLTNTSTYRNRAYIEVQTNGSTANKRGGNLIFGAAADNATAPTAVATIASTGLSVTGTLGVSTGAAVGGATPGAGGLAFPATAVAVADANTLDDYEEGTWTPTLTPATSGTITLNSPNLCAYTKIGRVVTVNGLIDTASVSAPVGASVSVNNLPFTSNATGTQRSSGDAVGFSLTSGTVISATTIVSSTTTAGFQINASLFQLGSQVYFQLSYTV